MSEGGSLIAEVRYMTYKPGGVLVMRTGGQLQPFLKTPQPLKQATVKTTAKKL